MIKVLVRCQLCSKVIKRYVQKHQKEFIHCGTRQAIEGNIIEGKDNFEKRNSDDKQEKKEEITEEKQEEIKEKSNNNDRKKDEDDEWY